MIPFRMNKVHPPTQGKPQKEAFASADSAISNKDDIRGEEKVSEKMQYPKLHIVAGPTASGKTSFAIELAKEINGELINADSRQIYKCLDVGTNKGRIREIKEVREIKEIKSEAKLPVFEIDDSGVNIHLLSFVEPDRQFSLYEYQQLAYQQIEQIIAAAKIPIIVGGTGLYIDAIMHPEKYQNLQGEQKNPDLRAELTDLPIAELQARLEKLAPDTLAAMNESDRQNPRRLIRKIELASLPQRAEAHPQFPKYNFEVHYIDKPFEELEKRINSRVVEMFEQGIMEEVQEVLDMGFPEDSVALQGIGYREVLKLIRGEIDESECIRLVQIAHRQYAKRQATWFKKHLKE